MRAYREWADVVCPSLACCTRYRDKTAVTGTNFHANRDPIHACQISHKLRGSRGFVVSRWKADFRQWCAREISRLRDLLVDNYRARVTSESIIFILADVNTPEYVYTEKIAIRVTE